MSFIHIKAANIPQIKKQYPPKVLYKYIPLNYALQLLQDNTLYFSNPTSWKDRYEKKVILGKWVVNGIKQSYPLKDKIYATCFTSEYSSEPQWTMYLSNHSQAKLSEAVEICFDFDKLRNLLAPHDVYFGQMKYHRQHELRQYVAACFQSKVARKAFTSKNPLAKKNIRYLLRPLLFKRKAFAYENEWRLFIDASKLNHSCLYVPNIKDAINEIIIDTKNSTPADIARIKAQIALHISCTIRESQLFTANNHQMRFEI